ncbi:acyl carrier protein [Piscinibacter koreensis]|uniref:Acyl carrier protein n=1 Tax=Piscinibacter koreensis TaxID=2742824 RepID=A0A7Y6NRW4_9BURK|nr:acyl carrier protein [Schlegelella koreensis]NUZ08190.1 acyl carrier protein [Schlegelella koreensis]
MVNEQTLRQVMATVLRIPVESINENTSMDDVESWDSLKHMNLVLALEDEFKVSIPDEDAANITSYQLIKVVLDELVSG